MMYFFGKGFLCWYDLVCPGTDSSMMLQEVVAAPKKANMKRTASVTDNFLKLILQMKSICKRFELSR
jgi:hypothetical protein